MGILANENAISSGGYVINNSLRFQSASSQYLTRTPASTPTSFTISLWIKRGTLSVFQCLMYSRLAGNATAGGNNGLYIGSNDTISFSVNSADTGKTTTAVYRDPSAWYHIVVNYNGSGTSAIYVNNVQQATTGSNSGTNKLYNSTGGTNAIGRYGDDPSGYFDGYMTEVNFVDGQALTPSSFGQTNSLTGQWVAAKYTGTYGTNGFYLPFSNGTSTTTLGADSSGNSNNWTLTNFTRSAGVSDCFMFDVPSGNGSGSGTQPSSNYCVLNPLFKDSSVTVSNSNLFFSTAANSIRTYSSIGIPTTGKWYWEVTATTGLNIIVGIGTGTLGAGNNLGSSTGDIAYNSNANSGTIVRENSNLQTGLGSTSNNDVISVALNMDAGTIAFYKNNVQLGSTQNIPTTTNTFLPALGTFFSGATGNANFGNRSFTYTPPTGFKALCTANLPASTIVQGNKYMDATTYTGTGASLAVTNTASFKPDFVWVKGRSGATDHALYDSVRGSTLDLVSNTTAAETTQSTGLTAFNTNGFTVGALAKMNTNTATYVGWQWQAGSGTSASNTNGSITSTVSVGATQGFSVVTRTGTGVAGTIGHGLGVAPKMIINKSRSNGAYNWSVYHASLTNANYVIYLDATNAQGSEPTAWNATAPTSSVFSVGTSAQTNLNTATYVSYCFSEIAGFSKFGSYVGNGSADGPFIYTGFLPKYIMIKRTDAASDWFVFDIARNNYYNSGNDGMLSPNTSGAEGTGWPIDFLSNGIKNRYTSATNQAGATFIYACFATNPFASSNAF